ncbi:hypothetical protein T4E_7907 [Trichinella pseudospiralis]|uniref:Uncharacterized protein n=1 Tax=Trichinella pseudospiralis TaxID=6337 RepID=A0A0V0Y1X1_TRIPS|nr:hypothetical protein T4E_7907 [Trichinella pseudospiralis]
MTCTITRLELDEARFGHLSWHTQMLSELEDHCIGFSSESLRNMRANDLWTPELPRCSFQENTAEAASMKLRLPRKRSHRANSRYEFIDSNDNAKRMNLHSCLDGIISEAIAGL